MRRHNIAPNQTEKFNETECWRRGKKHTTTHTRAERVRSMTGIVAHKEKIKCLHHTGMRENKIEIVSLSKLCSDFIFLYAYPSPSSNSNAHIVLRSTDSHLSEANEKESNNN